MVTPPKPAASDIPPEVWASLREPIEVRPNVVARVRAALAAGERPTPDQVALAMMSWPYRGAA